MSICRSEGHDKFCTAAVSAIHNLCKSSCSVTHIGSACCTLLRIAVTVRYVCWNHDPSETSQTLVSSRGNGSHAERIDVESSPHASSRGLDPLEAKVIRADLNIFARHL